ncbi:MAG: serine hydrolase domain-containing protein [Vicinamibacteraceae bacterium]
MLGLLGATPVAAGAVLAMPGIAQAESTLHGRIPKALRPGGEYDQFIAYLAGQDQFSGIVLLSYRGRPVLERAYGMANKDASIPNQMDTLFGLGSINKCFTAVAVMQLAQEGKISFHEKLGAYLDGFPAEIADAVTVHQLLTHTAGVGRPAKTMEPPTQEELSWDSIEEVWEGNLTIIRGLPLRFVPGTRYQYSNDGFIVLGAIIQAASNQNYYDYIREHVLTPAGMARTGFYTRPDVLSAYDIARPYALDRMSGERFDFTTSERFSFVGTPAGGAYSTVGELLKFVRALGQDGPLLGAAFVDLATSGKTVVPPEGERDPWLQGSFYGYGFGASIFNSRRLFGHTGGGPGVGDSYNVYPDLDWVSVILGNYEEAAKPIVGLERRLITQQ